MLLNNVPLIEDVMTTPWPMSTRTCEVVAPW
jgi:hypothetical protein